MYPYVLLCFLMLANMCTSQAQLEQNLAEKYPSYREAEIQDRRFKHAQVEKLIKALPAEFQVKTAGVSIEGRNIYQVSIGQGPVKVLLWSQMHGDESTATMALMDIFRFLQADDEFNPFRQQLLRELTLVFLPMLNPDGADRFTRRNALGVDLNRDALRLQSPESQILKRVRDELPADWGFNLHDQNRYYGAGRAPKIATISFLAPAYNYEKEVNEVRGRAMQLIVLMNETLQRHIPGQVARYNDDFEPRAFGDNIQKWGTSTILIESGGLRGDPEKQEIRKLNFLALLMGLEAIASKRYAEVDRAAYESLPFNDSNAFFDLLLHEVEVEREGKWYTVDLGYRREEVENRGGENFFFGAHIQDMGDLSIFHAYEHFDGKGYRVTPGKLYPTIVANRAAYNQLDYRKLWQQGYTAVRISEPTRRNRSAQKLQILSASDKADDDILPWRNPGLLLHKDGELKYVLIDGNLWKL